MKFDFSRLGIQVSIDLPERYEVFVWSGEMERNEEEPYRFVAYSKMGARRLARKWSRIYAAYEECAYYFSVFEISDAPVMNNPPLYIGETQVAVKVSSTKFFKF